MGTISDKLTYLNTTKGKIKDSINLTGANIGANDTFRSYSTKLRDAYVDIINNGTGTLYTNFPKETGTGTDVTLNNTYNAPMGIDLKGNTYQQSYSGKNLFDISIWKNNIPQIIGNGSSITISDNTITISNPNGADTYTNSGMIASGNVSEAFRKYLIPVKSNTTYTLSFNASGTTRSQARPQASYYSLIDENFNTISFSNISNFTIPSFHSKNIVTDSNTKYIAVRFGSSIAESGETPPFTISYSNIQIEEGSTATDWEKYVGGTASPNPDYPQNIEVVTGNNSVNICGKNLEQEIEQGNINSSGVPYTDNTSIRSKYYDLVKPSTDYIVSNNGTAVGCNISQYDENQTFISRTYYSTGAFTTSSITKYVKVQLVGSTTDKIQLEQGSTATTYEAYQGATYPVNLGSIELCKIPNTNYEDEIKRSTGKNLFDKDNVTSGTFYNTSDGSVTSNNDWSQSDYIEVKNGSYITISSSYKESNSSFEFSQFNSSKQWISSNQTSLTTGNRTYQLDNNTKYIKIGFRNDRVATSSIQVEYGSTATDYEHYGVGVWYKKGLIGKVVLDGSENWNYVSASNLHWLYFSGYKASGLICLCNYYISQENVTSTGNMINKHISFRNDNTISNQSLYIKNTDITSKSDFQTWLSTHNTIVYYVLATPTTTEITDTTLKGQLEAIYNAYSNNNQTNISQENAEQPFILNISALSKVE